MGHIALASTTVLGNMIDPNAPPRWDPLEAGFAKGIARLLIPFFLTFCVEVPIVAFLLRRSLPIAIGALMGIVVSAVSYPVAFSLYWGSQWGITGVELCVMALETILLLGAFATAGRLNFVVASPTFSRILSTAVISNLASWLVGKVFLG